MRILLLLLMIANAALFFFGAVQHAGLAIGPFHEPHILPASIVEALCGIALACGAAALVACARRAWGVAVTANVDRDCRRSVGHDRARGRSRPAHRQ
ncbi:MAG: hypothetical protein JOY62_16970 [Acidobacteriaceae bacterium]|nr:hypothetical protein [Acidobacteriaceae bacterium]MBV9781658.1 hypothetical protein [Acidobacteriaceae bacterium]